MKLRLLFSAVVLFMSFSAQAVPTSEDYAINLDEQIPNTDDLLTQYRNENSDYNRHYSFRWRMPEQFDTTFSSIYQNLAADERHLSSRTEDEVYDMVKSLPKEMYQYIGPYLHTLPQLSGRVLDMPGIKETKNKFPERIAERFKNIENIEYLSPALYIYLMPEMVGEGKSSYEYPQLEMPEYRSQRALKINPEFLKKVASETPLADFTDSSKRKKSDGIRHFIADKNTPLSGADVKAFSNTLGDLHDFNTQNRVKLIATSGLISYWDEQNGAEKGFYLYKQMANPCSSMVRNVIWSNKSLEFQNIIGKNGFGLHDWASVCDKTLKAYRRANMSLAMSMMLYGLNTNQHLHVYEVYGMHGQDLHDLENLLGAAKEMHNATKEDVEAVKPYMNKLHKSIPETNSYFLGTPLIIP